MINHKNQESFILDLTADTPVREYRLYYNFNPDNLPTTIPCRLVVEWNNNQYDTGFIGDSFYNNELQSLGFSSVVSNQESGYIAINKNQQEPTTAKATIYTPIQESSAQLNLVCENNVVTLLNQNSLIFPQVWTNSDSGVFSVGSSLFGESGLETDKVKMYNYIINNNESINYVIPRRPINRALEGEDQIDVYLNDQYKLSLIFPKYHLKEYQLSVDWSSANNTSCPASSHMRYATGTFWVSFKINEDLYVWFSMDCRPGNYNIDYDPFNQSYSSAQNIYNFYKNYDEFSTNMDEKLQRNWGLLRCLMPEMIENWGGEIEVI